MRVTFFFALMTAWYSCAGFCAALSTLFPELTRLDLKNEGVTVWYPKTNAKPVKEPPPYLKEYDAAGVYASEPLLLDLGHGLPTLALACDSGPSNDPRCLLLPKFDNPDSTIFESAGNQFVFLPSGDIYVFGATDFTYDHRRLFRFDGKRFVEATQPFRYVGIEGKTRAALTLTSARNGETGGGKDSLATIAPGTKVMILLNAATRDNEYGQNPDYLVKTREGLIGWAHIPTKPDGTTIVEGLRFNGD